MKADLMKAKNCSPARVGLCVIWLSSFHHKEIQRGAIKDSFASSIKYSAKIASIKYFAKIASTNPTAAEQYGRSLSLSALHSLHKIDTISRGPGKTASAWPLPLRNGFLDPF
ncbi:hypothetical protein O6H91_02G043200 [Diphasiastrum complanatum]|uniref:Uncharacterized protein n=1 Tax=Diphasiastrum complanatum TaxID=34168 RepID=A0ACC2EEW7_DIPCM|nr:hypothetical protein O6H91_02G043200 [Diphasiastrum complanatum]